MNPTIARITARSLVGRRRFLLLLPLPLVLILLAALARQVGGRPHDLVQNVLFGFGLALVVPLTALIVGAGVLGLEIDDGTLLHLLAKPLPRREIVFTKLAVAGAISVVVTAPALLIAGVVLDSLQLGVAFAVGGSVAAVAYCAIFMALSLVFRRPVLIGLVYVVVWEGALGNLISGTGVLSVEQYAVTIAERLGPSALITSHVSAPVAVVMSVAVTLGATVLAVHRLRSFTVAGGGNG
jgi:ABC-2 type transport system permease protein